MAGSRRPYKHKATLYLRHLLSVCPTTRADVNRTVIAGRHEYIPFLEKSALCVQILQKQRPVSVRSEDCITTISSVNRKGETKKQRGGPLFEAHGNSLLVPFTFGSNFRVPTTPPSLNHRVYCRTTLVRTCSKKESFLGMQGDCPDQGSVTT